MSKLEDYKSYTFNNKDYYDEGLKSDSSSLSRMKEALDKKIISKDDFLNYEKLYNRVQGQTQELKEGRGGGSRRNKPTPKSKAKPQHEDMTMKDIKEMCKANLIKLSKVVEGKRVVYKKKELITKLKRKKLL